MNVKHEREGGGESFTEKSSDGKTAFQLANVPSSPDGFWSLWTNGSAIYIRRRDFKHVVNLINNVIARDTST